jgi:hypothetical protein
VSTARLGKCLRNVADDKGKSKLDVTGVLVWKLATRT